jgi:hypothetical protein
MKQASRDMRKLGRKGGLARADALGGRARTDIARRAADARWKPDVLVLGTPRDHEELQCFVAQYGNGYARSTCSDPTAVLHRAIAASRNDACLARMLPVFIWRARQDFLRSDRVADLPARDACALGYFFELAFRFGRARAATARIRQLRKCASSVKKPFVFFRLMDTSLLRERAAEMTSPTASAWNLILGEPDESYEIYFKKMIEGGRLAAL